VPEEVPDKLLPPEMRHNLFLIVKEALTNAWKHARANEVLVQAKASATQLELVVADDGVGWVFPPAGASTRNGLNNMQRRAESVRGNLQIQTAPGKGTRISITVDLPAAPQPKSAQS